MAIMKRLVLIFLIIPICFAGNAQDFSGKSVALHQFSMDFAIQNDQGEMTTKEYVKTYGTKRKTRAIEGMYEIMMPFVKENLAKKDVNLMPCEELAAVKANPYGVPNMMINKAIKSCKTADYFLRIAIKDITVINPDAPKTDLSIKMRTITMRCRIHLMDADKNPIKTLEGIFNSGKKIESDRDIGIDIRKITGTERDQELKVYESCCKMAFLIAMDKW